MDTFITCRNPDRVKCLKLNTRLCLGVCRVVEKGLQLLGRTVSTCCP